MRGILQVDWVPLPRSRLRGPLAFYSVYYQHTAWREREGGKDGRGFSGVAKARPNGGGGGGRGEAAATVTSLVRKHHRCSSRGSDYKDPPSTVFKTPPSILFMTPLPLENPLNNVLVQQMFAKMTNFAAYGGIIYPFLHIFFSSARNKFAPATAILHKL